MDITSGIDFTEIRSGLIALQDLCGSASAAKGFHDDRPVDGDELRNWQGNKLMLIVSEVTEAHEELRHGHTVNETYYPHMVGAGPFKPEGVPSEIADIVIRCLDFAYTEGIDLATIIQEKLAYNATRERLHGKAF